MGGGGKLPDVPELWHSKPDTPTLSPLLVLRNRLYHLWFLTGYKGTAHFILFRTKIEHAGLASSKSKCRTGLPPEHFKIKQIFGEAYSYFKLKHHLKYDKHNLEMTLYVLLYHIKNYTVIYYWLSCSYKYYALKHWLATTLKTQPNVVKIWTKQSMDLEDILL